MVDKHQIPLAKLLTADVCDLPYLTCLLVEKVPGSYRCQETGAPRFKVEAPVGKGGAECAKPECLPTSQQQKDTKQELCQTQKVAR